MTDYKIAFDAIGTFWEIEVFNFPTSFDKKQTQKEISKIISEFDLYYSRFNKKSTIFKASQNTGDYKLPDNSARLFKIYRKLYKATDGLFTPLIGQTLSDAGYDANYSFKKGDIKSPTPWEKAIKYKGNNLKVFQPVILDFGAGGKGYLVDLVANYLISKNLKEFTINAGGDILARQQELIIGLENPNNLNQVIGTTTLKNKSIAASSGNRRKWGNYHHIVNPKTLKSPDNILSTWVVADDTITADVIATALFLVEKERLLKVFSFEFLILFSDFTISKSLHFEAKLFYDSKE